MDGQQRLQATSTSAITGSVNVAAGSVVNYDGFNIKQEHADTDFDIGPTELQNMDNQLDTSIVKKEYTIKNDNINLILSGGVKDEIIEDEWRDRCGHLVPAGSLTPHEVVMTDRDMCCVLPSLELKMHKDRFESTCRVHLTQLDTSLPFKSRKAKKKQQLSAAVTDSRRSNKMTQSDQPARTEFYSCDRCVKTFNHHYYFKQHCKYAHLTECHKCAECNKEFTCKLSLDTHAKIVHSGQQYECTICKKVYKTKEGLKRHHQPRPAVPLPAVYSCDYCQKRYPIKQSLVRHIDSAHTNISHSCSLCKNDLRSKRALQRHMKQVHSKEKHECQFCKKVFSTKQYYKSHVHNMHSRKSASTSEHFGSETRVNIRDDCRKTLATKTSIENHITDVQAGGSSKFNKSFKCDRLLKLQTANVRNVRMKVCNVCGKSLWPSNLRQHMRNKHGDEQLQCKLCGETMKSKQCLHQHLKDFHNQQSAESHQQAICSNIRKELKSKRNSQKHEKIYTSVRPPRMVILKAEPADGELELGPVAFQRMDYDCGPYKQESQLD